MNFNQRLRRKMAEKGPQAAKKWEKRLEENALKFNTSENQHAEEIIRDFKNQRSLMFAR
ncbi:TPA: hypothetical protein ACGC1O_004923 [Bacillus cereus]|uniref:hypothetical protein n=1 Tax=Bacillus thuringiensis TaxID=1428 RepID=UPI001596A723|nr:hypothetical protein [Bacillus thuringiensis]